MESVSPTAQDKYCTPSFQHWRVLLVVGFTNLLAAMVYSLPAPFYPKEAESKGMTATEYGFVFGVHQLTQFFASPICGSNMHRTTPQLVYTIGALMQGVTVAVFGLLDMVKTHELFLGLSLLLRFLEALGAAMLFTAGNTIVTKRAAANDSVAASFALLELAFGLGYSIGPVLGEALFVVGGFGLPFFVLGGLLGAAGLVLPFFKLEQRDGRVPSLEGEEGGRKGLLELLAVPHVALQSLALLIAVISISFIYSSLEPHLRQFHLAPASVGLAFLVPGMIHAILSPLAGIAFDRIRHEAIIARITVTGLVANCIAIVLVGPLPLLQLRPQEGLTFGALLIFGVTTAVIYLSTFLEVLKTARVKGYLNPNALAAGWWSACMCLGGFVGPVMAGGLTDAVGFQHATYAILGLTLVVLGGLVVRECVGCIIAKSPES